MEELRKQILESLTYNPKQSFNELWNKNGDSNKFAYHLKIMLEKGLIEKQDNTYRLSKEGKKLITYSGGKEQLDFPYLGVLIIVFDNEGKILKCQRKKEPFYNYYAFISGSIKSKEYILEAGQRMLKTQTNLECDLELKGLFSSKTILNEEVLHSHQLFVLVGKNPKGEIFKTSKKGNIFWINPNEIPKEKKFPEHELLLEIANSKHFKWLEMDRVSNEKTEFIGSKISKDLII